MIIGGMLLLAHVFVRTEVRPALEGGVPTVSIGDLAAA
jgi:hypothetical protein